MARLSGYRIKVISTMNARGAILHWAVFGILAILGLFIAVLSPLQPSQEKTGEWQLGIIYDLFYKSQINLLELDLFVRNETWSIALELAQKGGFAGTSPCGRYQGINKWNAQGTPCFPSPESSVESELKRRLEDKTGRFFPTITLQDQQIAGNSDDVKSISGTDIYTYKYRFNVNLDYSFTAEYNQLTSEAGHLLAACRSETDLNICVQQKKKAHWHPFSCTGTASIPAGQRIVSFCVQSPNNYTVGGEPAQYSLALDFTLQAP